MPHLPHIRFGNGSASGAIPVPHHHPLRGMGCGVAGKILKGEVWQISAAGTGPFRERKQHAVGAHPIILASGFEIDATRSK
jgi:hypothetical protein